MNKGRWFRMIPVLALGLVLALAIGAAAAQQGEAQPFLGFGFEPNTDGVLVTQVLPGSPADEAGLESGDLITAINGDAVTAADITDAISSLNVGDPVDLSVTRNDETVDLTATLGERGDFLQPDNGQMPNLPFGNLGPQRVFLGVALDASDNGVVIREVAPDSPAATAGLQADDVVTAINGQAVTEPREAIEIIQGLNAGDTVTLDITRGGEAQTIEATLEAGDMPRGGFPGSPMDGDAIFYNGADNTWVVANVTEDSPLYAAGLRSGDVITAVAGADSLAPEAISEYVKGLAEDATVTLTVQRDGETQDIDVAASALKPLAEMPMFQMGGRGNDGFPFEFGMPGRMAANGRLGVAFQPLTAELAADQGVDVTEGALITEVAPETPAAEAGLLVNDIVTAVNGEAVDEEHTLRDRLVAYEPDDTVTLSILRAGETLDVDVTLDAPEMGRGGSPFDNLPGFFGSPNLPDGEPVPAEPAGNLM
jgi:S1-C subfamily serine protease